MGYENAPSTQMLATHCCACGRPLRDAQSVQFGIGPVCAEKYGFFAEVPQTARDAANKIIHRASCDQRLHDTDRDTLIALGFRRLAFRIAERLQDAKRVSVRVKNHDYVVSTPYHEMALVDFRQARKEFRGRWDREMRVNRFPCTYPARKRIWGILVTHFAGCILETDSGESIIPKH